MNIFKKTIAGLILTPFYSSPRGAIDILHNTLYGSFIYKYFLRSSKLIHVLNKRDDKLLKEVYKVKNIYTLPIGIDLFKLKSNINVKKSKNLHIIFVGELSTRKGVDTICDIIKNSPKNFIFHIVGDGPLKGDIIFLNNSKKCIYYGYVNNQKLYELYSASDILLFPSRAEAFGIVMAEAMSFGLKIVNSAEVSLGLPPYIETSLSSRFADIYIQALTKIAIEKKQNKIDRGKIKEYAKSNYSDEKIIPLIMKEMFHVKI